MILDNASPADTAGTFVLTGPLQRVVFFHEAGFTHDGPTALLIDLTSHIQDQPTVLASGAMRVFVLPCVGDTALVDFNNAFNPPCALNDFATCPLPPPQNRLKLRVDAGEKRYAGGPEHRS